MIRSWAMRIFELPGGASRYQAMEGLRAYAALLVFLVHFFGAFARIAWDLNFDNFQPENSDSIAELLTYYLFASHYGVDLFFLLSGFLICRMVHKNQFDFGRFIHHRVLRIYPAFLLAIAIYAGFTIIIWNWYEFDLFQLLANLVFFNAVPALNVTPYNMATWSLFYEFVFYLTFPVILLIPGARSRAAPVATLIYGICIVIALQYFLGGMFIRFAMFFAGVMIAYLDDSKLAYIANKLPLAFVISAYVGSTLFFASELSYSNFVPVFWLTASLLVIKVIFGKGLLNSIFSSTPLRYFGNMSYSFYLMHGFGIEIVMRHADGLISVLGSGVWLAVTFCASFALSCVLSAVLFLLAEKPYFTRRQAPVPVKIVESPAV